MLAEAGALAGGVVLAVLRDYQPDLFEDFPTAKREVRHGGGAGGASPPRRVLVSDPRSRSSGRRHLAEHKKRSRGVDNGYARRERNMHEEVVPHWRAWQQANPDKVKSPDNLTKP